MNLQIDTTDIINITGLSGTQLYEHQRRKNDLIELIGMHLPDKSRLLDVGCASGDIAIELAKTIS